VRPNDFFSCADLFAIGPNVGHSSHLPGLQKRLTQRPALARGEKRCIVDFISRAIILRELANCLYESRTGACGTFQHEKAADSRLAEESA
jgi:hypothetical protein